MKGPVTNAQLNERRSAAIPKGHASLTGCYVQSGKGALLYDVEGREYIDFAGGIAVMNVGHSHPKVVAAIKDQAEQFTHTCFMVMPYAHVISLAEKLQAVVPGNFAKSVLFINSGAEAVENAVKIARYCTKRPAVIAFEHGFHGRTMLGMTLTSKVKPYKFGFGPFVPEVYHAPFAYCYRCPFNLQYPSCDVGCADYLQEFFLSHVAPESTAAMIVEPIQGEGGFITPPPEYFPKLKKICEANGILFIADEIQTGMGRTGTMFAMEHCQVEADLTTVAKSLAAGMPLSAVVGRSELMDCVHAGGIGGTYGGNPVACRAALAVLEVFESENLLDKAKRLGVILRRRLDEFRQKYAIVGDVRGIGPMLAMELVKDRTTKAPATDEAKALLKYCFDRGLIILACGGYSNVIRLLMPLVIEQDQLDKGLTILEEGLSSLDQ
ncbi:4-aminobutyrate--2-oxoglutarate transaminase [Desulfoferrobacter suflitae]|uniref:4-aminobutyrate--2-oxoglutarate transaminase n=1 Tax=Desulfoferrobacter suflitae TaxID=2865782 RepID=UPI00216426F7|nr:4-aminobutyrate--2-oxoglutarate transaminase [Desulfoferrobacter suflitae]MCK8603029.1 4-aminobutyrate--2-oxoglutarate transaminase [Desulfoferrobacter suflitae]